jgi:hypothetical protein
MLFVCACSTELFNCLSLNLLLLYLNSSIFRSFLINHGPANLLQMKKFPATTARCSECFSLRTPSTLLMRSVSFALVLCFAHSVSSRRPPLSSGNAPLIWK